MNLFSLLRRSLLIVQEVEITR